MIIVRSAQVRNLILGFAMSKWRLLRLLIMSLRQMTFISTIRLLHSNGINLAKSIRVSANSVRNTPFYDELRDRRRQIRALRRARSPPPSPNTPRSTPRSPTCSPSAKNPPRSTPSSKCSPKCMRRIPQNHMNTFSAAISFIVLLIAVVTHRRRLHRHLPADLPDGPEDDAKRRIMKALNPKY